MHIHSVNYPCLTPQSSLDRASDLTSLPLDNSGLSRSTIHPQEMSKIDVIVYELLPPCGKRNTLPLIIFECGFFFSVESNSTSKHVTRQLHKFNHPPVCRSDDLSWLQLSWRLQPSIHHGVCTGSTPWHWHSHPAFSPKSHVELLKQGGNLHQSRGAWTHRAVSSPRHTATVTWPGRRLHLGNNTYLRWMQLLRLLLSHSLSLFPSLPPSLSFRVTIYFSNSLTLFSSSYNSQFCCRQ